MANQEVFSLYLTESASSSSTPGGRLLTDSTLCTAVGIVSKGILVKGLLPLKTYYINILLNIPGDIPATQELQSSNYILRPTRVEN